MENAKAESHLRSVIKGITWRVIGTIDTIVISFFLSGKFNTALKIGFTEVATKIILYYLHERLWVLLQKDKAITHKISLIKAFSWRITGTLDTIMLAWFFTGNPTTGMKIGASEIITKVILFYLHERLWARVPIGTVRKWFGIRTKES